MVHKIHLTISKSTRHRQRHLPECSGEEPRASGHRAPHPRTPGASAHGWVVPPPSPAAHAGQPGRRTRSWRARVCRCAAAGRRARPAAPLLVGDLHAKRLFILVLVVVDVNQDLLLPGAVPGSEPQADGVGLPSPNLEASIQSKPYPGPPSPPAGSAAADPDRGA